MKQLQIAMILIGFVVSAMMMVVPQLQFARANYPKSGRWLLYRFGSSFVGGLLLGLTLFVWEFRGVQLLVWTMLPAVASGILLTFVFPYNMQRVIPKRDTQDDD